jgi:ribosomal protein S18 acetylase RimI-like enzyme
MIRQATQLDLDQIWQLRLETSQLLKERKIDQWQYDQPDIQTFKKDIDLGYFYVYLFQEKVVGMISIQSEIESTYHKIYQGAWGINEPYMTIHRLAISKEMLGQGIAKKMILFAENHAISNHVYYMRIDTHQDNRYAISLFESLGYIKRGIILLNLKAGDNRRLAYDKILKT